MQWSDLSSATKAETLEIVQTRARREVVGLEAGLFILEIIVGISPLLGLLGAVTGLVKVFANIGSGVTSTSDLKEIASGISEALSTTIVGLAIAILAIVAWSTFTRRVETLAIQMESLVTELIEKMFQRGGRGRSRSSPGNPRGGHSMKFYVKRRKTPQIIIVSLIDIFAILLIFFIVTTTFKTAQSQLSINLPEAKSATQGDGTQEPLVLSITTDEKIYLGDKQLAGVDELAVSLKEHQEKSPNQPVAMNAD